MGTWGDRERREVKEKRWGLPASTLTCGEAETISHWAQLPEPPEWRTLPVTLAASDLLQRPVRPVSPGRLLDLFPLGRHPAELLSGLSTWTCENYLILDGPMGWARSQWLVAQDDCGVMTGDATSVDMWGPGPPGALGTGLTLPIYQVSPLRTFLQV